MSTASLGRSREYAVRDDLARHGWTFIMRAAASKGVADLLMGHPTHGAALVQVGSRTKTIGPASRELFCHHADLCHALAILGVVVPRQGITYWHVNTQLPALWGRWTP